MMNQLISNVVVKNCLKSQATKNDSVTKELHHATHLLAVLANGTGDELLTKSDTKSIGAHPFSESTRRRKIKDGEYPRPIMLSGQMSLWRARDIKEWLNDPKNYRNFNQLTGGVK